MNDLEHRLRAGLHELADTLPPSEDARADLQRRLARPNRRKPVFVATAAAVAIVAVAVPVVLNQRADPVVTPPATSTSAPLVERAPIVLGRFDENGVDKALLLMVTSDGKGWCVAVSAPDADPKPHMCWGVPTWQSESVPGRYVLAMSVEESAPGMFPAQLPDLVLFVAAPQVATLKARHKDGSLVTVRELARTSSATFFLADRDGDTHRLRYTARDREGNLVEAATE